MNQDNPTFRHDLMVVSKVKQTIRQFEEMHTSSEVPEMLTDHCHQILKLAIQNAKNDGRKTVMGRDIKAALFDMLNKNGSV